MSLTSSPTKVEKSFDPIKMAIENYDFVYKNFLKKVIENSGKISDVEKSTRARSRELPSLIQELGLLGVLSYYYGKSEKENYSLLIQFLEKKSQERDIPDNTKMGYAVILYLALRGIEALNIIKIDYKDPYSSITELNKEENLNKVAVIEKLLIPYLVEIKRLCEGTLRSEI